MRELPPLARPTGAHTAPLLAPCWPSKSLTFGTSRTCPASARRTASSPARDASELSQGRRGVFVPPGLMGPASPGRQGRRGRFCRASPLSMVHADPFSQPSALPFAIRRPPRSSPHSASSAQRRAARPTAGPHTACNAWLPGARRRAILLATLKCRLRAAARCKGRRVHVAQPSHIPVYVAAACGCDR